MDLAYWKKEEVATRPSALGLSDPERTIFLGQQEHVSVWLTNMSVQLTNVSVHTRSMEYGHHTRIVVNIPEIWSKCQKYGQHTISMVNIPEMWPTYQKYGQHTRNMDKKARERSVLIGSDKYEIWPRYEHEPTGKDLTKMNCHGVAGSKIQHWSQPAKERRALKGNLDVRLFLSQRFISCNDWCTITPPHQRCMTL